MNDLTDMLAPDVPGHVALSNYSLDADRAYALERDRISAQYRQASVTVLESIARFDAPDGPLQPGLLPGIRDGLQTLNTLAGQLKSLPVPPDREGLEAEHRAFAGSLMVRTQRLSGVLDDAQGHADLVQQQMQRRAILRDNKAAGLPFHHGLEEAGLLTAKDTAVIGEGHLDGLDPTGKALARARLKQADRRLNAPAEFNLTERASAAVAGSHHPDEVTETLAQAAELSSNV